MITEKRRLRVTASRMVLTVMVALLITIAPTLSVSAEQDKGESRLARSAGSDNNLVEIDVTDCHDHLAGTLWRFSDGQSTNTISFDSAAYYLATELPVIRDPSGYFEFRGSFAKTRWMSYQAYEFEGGGFSDLIQDFEIEPSMGQINPFSSGEPFPSEMPDYALPVIYAPLEERDANASVLYVGHDVKDGSPYDISTVFLRYYFPSEKRDLPYPKIYFVYDPDRANEMYDKKRLCKLIPETEETEKVIRIDAKADTNASRYLRSADSPARGFAPPDDPVRWGIVENEIEFGQLAFPLIPDWLIPEEPLTNLNVGTRYFGAWLDPLHEPDPLAVLRFRAPTVPDTQMGEAVIPSEYETRYWSICSHQAQNAIYALSCASDVHFRRDTDAPEWITLVFSHPEDRPQGVCNMHDRTRLQQPCEYNWMPFPSSIPLILFRPILPSEHFVESPFFFDGDPLDTWGLMEHMGDTYPHTVYCSKEQFESDHCLAAWEQERRRRGVD